MTRHYNPIFLGMMVAGPTGPWWDPLEEGLCTWAVYQPKGAANFAASLLDLSGNGNNAGDPGGANTPAWDAVNGWRFVSIEYLTTTFVAQNDQSQTVIARYSSWIPGTGKWPFGSSSGVRRTFGVQLSTTDYEFHNGWYLRVNAVPPTNATVAVAGDTGYLNAMPMASPIDAWSGASTFPVYIGCLNNSGVTVGYILANIPALVIYDCRLTGPQITAITAAMAAL